MALLGLIFGLSGLTASAGLMVLMLFAGAVFVFSGTAAATAWVTSDATGVRYRSWFRARHIPRSDIESISVQYLSGWAAATARAPQIGVAITTTSDEKPVLPIALRTYGSSKNRARLQAKADLLHAHLEAPPPPATFVPSLLKPATWFRRGEGPTVAHSTDHN